MSTLVDYTHPIVRETASRLTRGKTTDLEKVEAIFYFVRDEIAYMLLPGGDEVLASEIITAGKGQCNNKNIVFLALCKAAGIPARIHFGLIVKDIARGLTSEAVYKRMPNALSHSWMEVQIDGTENGKWKRIDTHILDEPYFNGSKKKLTANGWSLGYAVADISINDFILYDVLVPDTPIIAADHGTYEVPEDYFASTQYTNKLTGITKLLYKLFMNRMNQSLEEVRDAGRN